MLRASGPETGLEEVGRVSTGKSAKESDPRECSRIRGLLADDGNSNGTKNRWIANPKVMVPISQPSVPGYSHAFGTLFAV